MVKSPYVIPSDTFLARYKKNLKLRDSYHNKENSKEKKQKFQPKKGIFSTRSKPTAQPNKMWSTLNFCTFIDCIVFQIYARFLPYFKLEAVSLFSKR